MDKIIQILHLEDDSLDQELIKSIINTADFKSNIVCVESEKDYIKQLQNDNFDIILADYKLPFFDGMSALTIARKMKPEIPFVFVSGAIGEEMAIEAMRAGAKDYVLKNSYKRLVPSIKRALNEAEERSKRFKVEEDLRENRQKLKQLFDSCPEGIVTLTLDLKIVEANQAFVDMIVYSLEELKNTTFFDIAPTKWHEKQKEVTLHILENAYGVYEKEFIRKDNKVFPVSITAWLIFDNKGNPKEIGAFVRDITEKKLLEEEIKLHQSMENQLERVTALSHLSSAITHEIKQPLQSIKVITESILYLHDKGKSLPYEEVLGDVRDITDRVDRVNNIINSIRSLINAPEKFNVQIIEINKQINQALDFYKQKLNIHNIKLQFNKSKKEINGFASEIQLQQVIINLIENAINSLDAVQRDEKIIVISSYEEGNKVVIKADDNGTGLNKECKSRIFDAFYSLSANKNNSTGMGLYIVNNIIKCFGGTIEAEDNEYGGATFIIKLRKS